MIKKRSDGPNSTAVRQRVGLYCGPVTASSMSGLASAATDWEVPLRRQARRTWVYATGIPSNGGQSHRRR